MFRQTIVPADKLSSRVHPLRRFFSRDTEILVLRSSVREQDSVVVRLQCLKREGLAQFDVSDEVEPWRLCNFTELFFAILTPRKNQSERRKDANARRIP